MGPMLRRSAGDAEGEVLLIVREHAAGLLRFARRYSLCADDAQDAYQRAMEILVRRMRTAPPENPLPWLRTVIRNECSAVREQRQRLLGREELDVAEHEDPEFADPSDRVEQFERLAQAAEALRRLKPQEVTALALRAEGLTYDEICSRTGWTYTRTNRCVTEGRRALLQRLNAIESGAECDRWLPLLSELADGEASAHDLAELRPHLRRCAACRATLREFHDAPRQVGALVPVLLLPGVAGAGVGFGRHLEAVVHSVLERVTLGAMRMQGAVDALPGAKLAAVAASTAAIAGGGAAIDHAARHADAHPRASHPSMAVSSTSKGVASVASAPLVPSGSLGSGPSAAASDPRGVAAGDPRSRGEFAFEFASARPGGSRPAKPRATAASDPTGTAAGQSRPIKEFQDQQFDTATATPAASTPPPSAAPGVRAVSPSRSETPSPTQRPAASEFAGP